MLNRIRRLIVSGIPFVAVAAMAAGATGVVMSRAHEAEIAKWAERQEESVSSGSAMSKKAYSAKVKMAETRRALEALAVSLEMAEKRMEAADK